MSDVQKIREGEEEEEPVRLRDEYRIVQPCCAVRETGGIRAVFLHSDGSLVQRPVILWILTERLLFGGHRSDNAPPHIEDKDLIPGFLRWKYIQKWAPQMVGFFDNDDAIECVPAGLLDPEHVAPFPFLTYIQDVEELREKLLRVSGLPSGECRDFELSEEETERFESSLRRFEQGGW